MRTCMDGWMCGCVDVWMCACVYVCMCACVDMWLCRCVDVWMYATPCYTLRRCYTMRVNMPLFSATPLSYCICDYSCRTARYYSMHGLLCSRTDGQGGRSAHGICATLAGHLSQAFAQRTVPIGHEQSKLPAIALVPCQRSIVPLFCKLFRSSHVKLCFASGCSCL